jgi:hypothetical protein
MRLDKGVVFEINIAVQVQSTTNVNDYNSTTAPLTVLLHCSAWFTHGFARTLTWRIALSFVKCIT